jgi:L-threonylcarbamoyladenylate synthase
MYNEYKNILNKSGGVCILPTETVYGIASLANDKKALDRIYAIKGRNFNKSLAVCVKDLGQAKKYGVFNKYAIKLAEIYWPGPVTIIVATKNNAFDERCYLNNTIAFRCPDVSWRQFLINKPLVLTSANRSGEANPKDANTTINALVDGVLDEGQSHGKVPSTIILAEKNGIKVIRVGKVSLKELENIELDWIK